LPAVFYGKRPANRKTQETEFYCLVPKLVTPGTPVYKPPCDAIVLFEGSNLDQRVSAKDTTKPAGWIVSDNIVTVNKSTGDIQPKGAL
jgi:hypothetical protein